MLSAKQSAKQMVADLALQRAKGQQGPWRWFAVSVVTEWARRFCSGQLEQATPNPQEARAPNTYRSGNPRSAGEHRYSEILSTLEGIYPKLESFEKYPSW